jgi:CMP-N,N'-diacetyllegionaminic acid synthase
LINGKKIIAIIPARGGSKGLPGKNIKPFGGKPLIAWTIEAGLSSQYIDEVMVTTDCEKIAEISKNLGAKVPFLRPAELSTDTAISIDVIRHAVTYYEENFGEIFDYVALLEPTSPLRQWQDIDNAIFSLAQHKRAKSIVGICRTESQNPAFLVRKDNVGIISSYDGLEIKVMRRQDIEDIYFFEGSVYVSETKYLLLKNTFYHNNTLGHLFPKWKSIEIDDLDDFIMAEALLAHRGSNS